MWLSRFGTTVVAVALGVIALLSLISGHWLLFAIFILAAIASWGVRGVKKSRGRG
jgi:hypothetical protein